MIEKKRTGCNILFFSVRSSETPLIHVVVLVWMSASRWKSRYLTVIHLTIQNSCVDLSSHFFFISFPFHQFLLFLCFTIIVILRSGTVEITDTNDSKSKKSKKSEKSIQKKKKGKGKKIRRELALRGSSSSSELNPKEENVIYHVNDDVDDGEAQE